MPPGRARPGGVAETLARWSGLGAPNAAWDDVDSVASVARMFRLRGRLRSAYADHPSERGSLGGLARALGVTRRALDDALRSSTFGVALEQLERQSRPLHPRRVPADRLVGEIGRAQRLIDAMSSQAPLRPESMEQVGAIEIAA